MLLVRVSRKSKTKRTEREKERERRKEKFLIRNWFLWLWRLGSSTIYRLKTGDPGELWYSSSPSLRPEDQESWWCKSWPEDRRLMSHFQRWQQILPSSASLFYASPQLIGCCPLFTLERAVCSLSPPTQMLKSSGNIETHPEIMFNQKPGHALAIKMTHQVDHHI